MKKFSIILFSLLMVAVAAHGEFRVDWAYHSSGDTGRLDATVPGENYPFLGNGSREVRNSDAVVLYLLTDQNFAGDMTEQVFVRWWDGTMSHWVMGSWVKNVTLDAATPGMQLNNMPAEGIRSLDLWKVVIPANLTRPGENFYAIQLKAVGDDSSDERYLLRIPGGDFSHTNPLGQVWSASEEFDGLDWSMTVLP